MHLHKFWGLVTVYKSNTRLKAVKKEQKKAWPLGQEESVTRDHSETPWDSRLLLTLICVIWTCWRDSRVNLPLGSEVSLVLLETGGLQAVVWMRERLAARLQSKDVK